LSGVTIGKATEEDICCFKDEDGLMFGVDIFIELCIELPIGDAADECGLHTQYDTRDDGGGALAEEDGMWWLDM